MLREPSPRRFTTRALALAAMTVGVATLVPFQLVARSAPPTSIVHSGPAPDAPPAAAVAQTPDVRDAGVSHRRDRTWPRRLPRTWAARTSARALV